MSVEGSVFARSFSAMWETCVGFQLSNSVTQLETFSVWATLSNRLFIAVCCSRLLIKPAETVTWITQSFMTVWWYAINYYIHVNGGLLCYIFVGHITPEIEKESLRTTERKGIFNPVLHNVIVYMSFQMSLCIIFCLLGASIDLKSVFDRCGVVGQSCVKIHIFYIMIYNKQNRLDWNQDKKIVVFKI